MALTTTFGSEAMAKFPAVALPMPLLAPVMGIVLLIVALPMCEGYWAGKGSRPLGTRCSTAHGEP